MISARIFVHPRCVQGPAAGALAAHLQGLGYDVNKVVAGPLNAKGHCELVRIINEGPLALALQRFDGTQFIHTKVPDAPEAA